MKTVLHSKRIKAIIAGGAALTLAAVSLTGCSSSQAGAAQIDDTQTDVAQNTNSPATSKDNGIHSPQQAQEISTHLMKLSENGTGTIEARPDKVEYLPDVPPTRFRAKDLDAQYGSIKANLEISPVTSFDIPADITFLPGSSYSSDYKVYRIGCDVECDQKKERTFESGTAIYQIDLKAKQVTELYRSPEGWRITGLANSAEWVVWEESPYKASVDTGDMTGPYPWRLMSCPKTDFLQKTCKPAPLDSDDTGQTNGPGGNLAIHQDVLLYATGRQLGGFNGDKLEYPSQAHVLNLKHPGTPRQIFTSHSRIFVGFTSKGVPLAFTNNNEVEWMYMEKHGNPTAWGFDPSKKWQAVKVFEGRALNGYVSDAAVGDRIIWQDYIGFPGMKDYPPEAPSDVVRYVDLTGEKIQRTAGETVLGSGHFLGKIFVREQVTQADHQCRASAVDLRSNGAVEFTGPGGCRYNAPGEASANIRDWGSRALSGYGDNYFFLSTWVHDGDNPASQTIHVYEVK